MNETSENIGNTARNHSPPKNEAGIPKNQIILMAERASRLSNGEF